MRIRKYDFNYSRRKFMENTAKGAMGGGVLAPLWPLIANAGDVSKAYPDELLSIDMYSKGKIKTGDVIDANNVDLVKELFDPVWYMQIKKMGRRVIVTKTTGTDVTTLFPARYLEATLRNKGKAKFGADGNVYAPDGGPWLGGQPFPDPKTALEVQANMTLSWGRHDYSQYAVRDWEVGPDGNVNYHYDFCWAELNTTARADGKVFRDLKDKVRLQSVWFTAPDDTKGTSLLNIWPYDQRQFPELYGYLPAFKRVRQFPTNQRFEPLVPGMTFFLSDAWAAGDPMLTWGNYKIVGRGPLLSAISPQNWFADKPNYEKSVHGGPKGQTFFDTYVELVPETIIIEAEPTGYPRAPVGKKRVWSHGVNAANVSYVTFDRRGDLWKSFEAGFTQYKLGNKVWKEPDGTPKWSWNYVMSFDTQSGSMTRFYQAEHESSGFKTLTDPPDLDYYNKYLTTSAIQRLGAA